MSQKITIKITDNKDRKELFDIICENLNVGITSMKSLFNVKSAIPSYDAIFKLLIKHELDFSFIGSEKKLVVICPVIQLTGTQLMSQPEKIEETKVDKIEKDKPKGGKGLVNHGADSGTMTMAHEIPEEEEDAFIDPNENEEEAADKGFDDEEEFDDDELPF